MGNKITEQSPLLRLESVSLHTEISRQLLLKNISFNVQKGDILGLIGGSGAGKTTLLRILNRLRDSTEGSIYFQNQELKTIPSISLRTQIVLVPQEPKLLGMTVKQALTYPLQLLRLTPTEIKSRLSYWIRELNIPEEWLERNELQLSLGQKQLVAIARALIMQPQVLLLDEPTSALDIAKADFILSKLTKLAENNNTTILISSHQLDLLKKYVQRVIVLDKGLLIQDKIVADIDWHEVNETLRQNLVNDNLDDF